MSDACRTPEQLVAGLRETRKRMDRAAEAAGRDAADVALVAVSKRHPAQSVRTLAQTGQMDFGENYVQEALSKQQELKDLALRWHFIGHLQSNKAKLLPGAFALFHGLDSLKLARALDSACRAMGETLSVLVQVNVAQEEQKSGIDEGGLPELVRETAAMPGLNLQGLMVMPPWNPDPEASRPHFARLFALRERLRDDLGLALPHLSMGMSHDLEVAVSEGATLVRAGTCVFGPRPAAG